MIFGACAVLVALALLQLTREVFDLERREVAAKEDARLHEAVRLALWRMDSTLAPVLAQEAARPSSDYPAPGGPALPARPSPSNAFKSWFAIDATLRVTPQEVAPFATALAPPAAESRASEADFDEVVQVLEDEEGSAKQQKADDGRKTEAPKERGQTEGFEKRLDADRESKVRVVTRDVAPPPPPAVKPADEVAAAAPESRASWRVPLDRILPGPQAAPAQTVAPQSGYLLQHDVQQREQSLGEYQSRQKMAFGANINALNNRLEPQTNDSYIPQLTAALGWMAEAGALEPRWIAGPRGGVELFLVRTVNVTAGPKVTQGIWCDWAKLQGWLLESTRDLFPDGRLAPAPQPVETDHATMLATIPARLVPGALPPLGAAARSPTRTILLVAWIAALGAVAAVGAVLRAAMSLGDRRGRFVSAVTHELRTPLTTFRMYSQMLADGMVPEGARGEYLATLKEESERLTRVVESVLLYSRLEEGRGGAHRETIACRALVDRVLPALVKRAADAPMTLTTTIEVAPDARVVVDVQAVEQIVLNLVDNACKYAAGQDPRLEMLWKTDGRHLRVRCRDWGPGIPSAERDLVFLPFSRGSRDAAGTTPGVGLGLALARGLARALGGDLALDSSPDAGAAFLLTVPLSA
jgi:signal transduction histidine kinase